MKPMFLSLVRPDRISQPITSTAAVTISGCAFMQVLFKQVLFKSGRTPSVAPRTTQVAEPMAQARLVPEAGPRSNFRHPLAFGLGSCQNKLTGLVGFFFRFSLVFFGFSWPGACRSKPVRLLGM